MERKHVMRCEKLIGLREHLHIRLEMLFADKFWVCNRNHALKIEALRDCKVASFVASNTFGHLVLHFKRLLASMTEVSRTYFFTKALFVECQAATKERAFNCIFYDSFKAWTAFVSAKYAWFAYELDLWPTFIIILFISDLENVLHSHVLKHALFMINFTAIFWATFYFRLYAADVFLTLQTNFLVPWQNNFRAFFFDLCGTFQLSFDFWFLCLEEMNLILKLWSDLVLLLGDCVFLVFVFLIHLH